MTLAPKCTPLPHVFMPIRRLFQIVEIMKKIVRCGANWKMYNIAYWLQPQKPNNESFVFCYNFLFLCLHTRIYYSILWLTRAGVGAFVYGCIDHDSQAFQAGLSDHVVLLGPGAEPPQPHRSRSQLLLLTAEHLKTTILSLVIVLWGVTSHHFLMCLYIRTFYILPRRWNSN